MVNGSIYQIVHVEGRAVPNYSSWLFEFNYSDHLGNLRLAFRDSSGVAAITQTENFGAWGESLKSLNYYRGIGGKEQFVFTGHERDEDLGVFDAKARMYDPLLPCFRSQDVLMNYLAVAILTFILQQTGNNSMHLIKNLKEP